MIETESRQVRRARERREASPPRLTVQRQAGNRATRRAQRKNDDEMIVRPTSLDSVASLRRARRDYRIRHKLRAPRGMVHPIMISAHRFTAIRTMEFIFAIAAKRAEKRRV